MASNTRSARSKAKNAHETLIAATHRTQADALEIEAMAKRRLADEYDAAQERGEVASNGQRRKAVPDQNSLAISADVGFSDRKAIHEARIIRDAEKAEPGIVSPEIHPQAAEKREPAELLLWTTNHPQREGGQDEASDEASRHEAG